jgi:hypothetical protein
VPRLNGHGSSKRSSFNAVGRTCGLWPGHQMLDFRSPRPGARREVRWLAQNCADMTRPCGRLRGGGFSGRSTSGGKVMETQVNIAFRSGPESQSERIGAARPRCRGAMKTPLITINLAHCTSRGGRVLVCLKHHPKYPASWCGSHGSCSNHGSHRFRFATARRLEPARCENVFGANVLTSLAQLRHLELVSHQSADSRIGQALHGMTQ